MTRTLWLIALLSCIVAPLCARADVPQNGGPIGRSIGVQLQIWQTTDNDLEQIEALGIGFVRWGLPWGRIEQSPGQYTWDPTDQFVERLKRHHLRPIIIIGGGNSLYTGATYNHDRMTKDATQALPPTDPASVARFARFAATAAQRYRDASPIWEIWNEPDTDRFWPPTADADAYVRLASATCAAIKRAAPGSSVIGPATASMPNHVSPFRRDIIAALSGSPAAACLDGVSAHDYRYDASHVVKTPESVADDDAAAIARIRSVPGIQHPVLICSEWGFATPMVTPAQQAEFVPRAILSNLAAGVPLTVLYQWRDAGRNPAEPEDNYGLLTADGQPKPSYAALSALLPKLRNAVGLREIEVGRPFGVRIALVTQPGGGRGAIFWQSSQGGPQRLVVIGSRVLPVGSTPGYIDLPAPSISIAVR